MNIHDRARQMAAQSKRPMTTSEALSILGSRGRRRRVVASMPENSPQLNAHLSTIETPRCRLPYKDD